MGHHSHYFRLFSIILIISKPENLNFLAIAGGPGLYQRLHHQHTFVCNYCITFVCNYSPRSSRPAPFLCIGLCTTPCLYTIVHSSTARIRLATASRHYQHFAQHGWRVTPRPPHSHFDTRRAQCPAGGRLCAALLPASAPGPPQPCELPRRSVQRGRRVTRRPPRSCHGAEGWAQPSTHCHASR